MSIADRCSRYLLLSVLGAAPFAFGAVEPWARGGLFTVIAVAGLAALSRPRGSRLAASPVASLCLALAFMGAVQALRAREGAGPSSWAPWTADRAASLEAALACMAYALGAMGFAAACRDERYARAVAWCAVAAGAAIAVVGIAQAAHGNAAYYGLRPVRHGHPFGPFVNYNHAALFMGMSALLGLGLLVERDPSGDPGRRALIILFAGLCLAGVAWSRSRAGTASVVLAASAFALGVLRSGWRRRTLLAGIAAVITVAVLMGPHHRFDRAGMAASMEFRLEAYRSALALIGDFPASGVGLGAFAAVFGAYQPVSVDARFEHLHNDGLELVCEIGIPGAMLLTALFLWSIRRRLRFPLSALRAGAAGACAVMLLDAALDFGFHIPANALMFIASFAILIGQESA